MKQAVCIQCHTNPELVNCIIRHLPVEYFDIYIHVDRKSSISENISHDTNVIFVKNRVDVRWGQFSQVEATLSMFREVDLQKYNYVHLISGNDFMAKKPEEIVRFFQNNHQEYIESIPLPSENRWTWLGVDRYSVYYPQWMIQRPADKLHRVIRVSYREFIMRTKIFKRRKFPVDKFYGGSSWFTITSKAVKWMLEYINNHPEYVRFFQHGVCSDEVFFSTLIRYSPYAKNITNLHLRYMNWRGNNTGGPRVLCEDEFPAMLHSDCIWARKFDDPDVTEKLYDFINDSSSYDVG